MDVNKYYEFKVIWEKVMMKLIVGAILGVVVGLYIGSFTDYIFAKIGLVILYVVVCSGYIQAWSMLPFYAWGFMGIVLKACIVVGFGWIVGPIALIYYPVKIKNYEKKNNITIIKRTRKSKDTKRKSKNTSQDSCDGRCPPKTTKMPIFRRRNTNGCMYSFMVWKGQNGASRSN